MHYGDKEQLDNNVLTLVVYKHRTNKLDKFEYEISSIVECKLFPPELLSKILNKPNKFFKNHSTLLIHEEEWNLIEIKDNNSTLKGCTLTSSQIVDCFNDNRNLRIH